MIGDQHERALHCQASIALAVLIALAIYLNLNAQDRQGTPSPVLHRLSALGLAPAWELPSHLDIAVNEQCNQCPKLDEPGCL